MKSRTNIFVAYALAGVFTLFNVGLPIILFVCPMMSAGQICNCNKAQTDGPAVSYPTGECCSHTIVAERNTTPFLSSIKFQVPASEVVLVLSSIMLPSTNPAHLSQLDNVSNTGPPPPAAPIYILSSSLLI
jgi:hypothetical protein